MDGPTGLWVKDGGIESEEGGGERGKRERGKEGRNLIRVDLLATIDRLSKASVVKKGADLGCRMCMGTSSLQGVSVNASKEVEEVDSRARPGTTIPQTSPMVSEARE